MTDMEQPEGSEPVKWAHCCVRCGAWACLGYNTHKGVVWYCTAHKALGEAKLVAPSIRDMRSI